MPEVNKDIRYVLLAEAALIAKSEQISIINIFDKVTPKKLPALFPRMFVATNFATNPNQDVKLTLEVVAPDGNIANKKEVTVNPGPKESMNYFFELLGTPIDQQGMYLFKITRDGEFSKEAILYVEPTH